ncbi:unnamed protein product [Pieris macdunnoughi]|uniref:Uncharacterized protein n=1 Tax=Pieris macdunnoughi TaxID=345717 RepID=A0A821WH49_9NEOP|nr:unnamed protein product [Pieris macdunnoughi]
MEIGSKRICGVARRSAATACAGMQQVTDSWKAVVRYRAEYLRQSNAPTSAPAGHLRQRAMHPPPCPLTCIT